MNAYMAIVASYSYNYSKQFFIDFYIYLLLYKSGKHIAIPDGTHTSLVIYVGKHASLETRMIKN